MRRQEVAAPSAGVDQVGGYPQAAVRRWRASDGGGVGEQWVGVRGEVEVQVAGAVCCVTTRAGGCAAYVSLNVTRQCWSWERLDMRSHGFFSCTAYR